MIIVFLSSAFKGVLSDRNGFSK